MIRPFLLDILGPFDVGPDKSIAAIKKERKMVESSLLIRLITFTRIELII